MHLDPGDVRRAARAGRGGGRGGARRAGGGVGRRRRCRADHRREPDAADVGGRAVAGAGAGLPRPRRRRAGAGGGRGALPGAPFADVFGRAADAGLPAVPHAGRARAPRACGPAWSCSARGGSATACARSRTSGGRRPAARARGLAGRVPDVERGAAGGAVARRRTRCRRCWRAGVPVSLNTDCPCSSTRRWSTSTRRRRRVRAGPCRAGRDRGGLPPDLVRPGGTPGGGAGRAAGLAIGCVSRAPVRPRAPAGR